MEFIERLVENVTGVEVDAFIFEWDYDSTTGFIYVPCLFNDNLAYFQFTADGAHISIYTDDLKALEEMGETVAHKKNEEVFAYINPLYDSNVKARYTMFKYKLEAVTQNEREEAR